jgi:hypothetical protein
MPLREMKRAQPPGQRQADWRKKPALRRDDKTHEPSRHDAAAMQIDEFRSQEARLISGFLASEFILLVRG